MTRRLMMAAALMVALATLVGCERVVEEAKQEVDRVAREEAARQVEEAKQAARDAATGAIDSAKEAVSLEKPLTPDLGHAAYTTRLNPLHDFSGHCTWFVWGRAYEKWGVKLPMTGDAGTWYDDKRGASLVRSGEPRADSIAVWKKGRYGHVAYIEKIEGDVLIINEANWVNPSFEQHGSGYTGKPTKVKVSDMATRYGTLAGYVYLPLP